MSIASIVLAIVLAVFFAFLGIGKVLATQQMRQRAEHMGASVTAYRVIGALELAGAAGLLIGIVWWPLGAAAGCGLILLMAGALAAHLRKHDTAQEYSLAVITGLIAVAYVVVLVGANR